MEKTQTQTKGNFHMKIKSIVVSVSLLFSVNAFAADFVSGTVPHYYQKDSTENPLGKYWCGHTALKMAADYVSGQYKGLDELHDIMKLNSAHYRDAKVCGTPYCARLYDLYMAAQSTKHGSYGQYNSVLRSVPDADVFLQKVKDGVINDLPPVAESNFDIFFGHFYVIVGYDEKSTAEDTVIYLRDPIKKNPVNTNWDTKTTIGEFIAGMYTRQFLFVKRN